MQSHSADNLIVARENQILENLGAKVATTPEPEVRAPEVVETETLQEKPQDASFQGEKPEVKEEVQHKNDEVASNVAEKSESTPENTDEYGNELPKPRMYTDEEVQNIIRDRLRRGNHGQQPQQAPQQSAQQHPQQPGEADWQQELKEIIKGTIGELTHEQQREKMQLQEQQIQAQFEVNFNMGASKFKDFDQVVAGKPITVDMMLATRAMKDPAAFIYAASKNHANELAEIAKNPDPYAQALLVGKLEEKMIKAARITSAPKPATHTASDAGIKPTQKKSVDDLIRDHARTKFRR